jgi:hypothetical protein
VVPIGSLPPEGGGTEMATAVGEFVFVVATVVGVDVKGKPDFTSDDALIFVDGLDRGIRAIAGGVRFKSRIDRSRPPTAGENVGPGVVFIKKVGVASGEMLFLFDVPKGFTGAKFGLRGTKVVTLAPQASPW